MASPFKHVRSGEPLVIHAAAYNAMLDAGQAVRNRRLNLAKQGSGFESLFVHVVNSTGQALSRFNVVGVDKPLVTNNEDQFCERIVMDGVKPTKEHKGKFAVLQEDAEPEQCVRACLYGVTIAKVESKSESESKIRFCDVKENNTEILASGGGGAEVLWHDKQSNWAIIRIGSGKSTLFPVTLSQTGGEQGDHEKVCSWTYTVKDALSDEELETDIDPNESPHEWKRPSLGAMTKASFGYAHYDNDDALVLGWINEVIEVESCGDEVNT
jgi:hypothetical protein